MPTFIYTPKGYVNLNSIEIAEVNRDNFNIVVAGNVIGDSIDFTETLLSAITPEGRWTCHTAGANEHDELEVISEPVLAWGFSVLGRLVPITVSEPNGIFEHYALSKDDSSTIRSPYGRTFNSVDEWLQSIRSEMES